MIYEKTGKLHIFVLLPKEETFIGLVIVSSIILLLYYFLPVVSYRAVTLG